MVFLVKGKPLVEERKLLNTIDFVIDKIAYFYYTCFKDKINCKICYRYIIGI